MKSKKKVIIPIAVIGICASVYGFLTSENSSLFIVTFISSASLISVLFENEEVLKNKDCKY
jgi:hypothetical protein